MFTQKCPLASIAAPKKVEPPPVEMIVDTEELQPSTTIEFRFTQPMVSRDDIGLSGAGPAQSDVLADRAAEQVDVLRDEGDGVA